MAACCAATRWWSAASTRRARISRLGVEDLRRFETLWPGLASRLITRHLDGLGDYARILDKPEGDIKTVIDVDEGFRVAG